jgi:imidazolonepropionase-like amidohydrolase
VFSRCRRLAQSLSGGHTLTSQAAHNAGIRVCSHARSDESIIQCLEYGVDIIYHASFISDGTMSMLERQKERAFVVPALNWLYGTLYDAEAFGCESEHPRGSCRTRPLS